MLRHLCRSAEASTNVRLCQVIPYPLNTQSTYDKNIYNKPNVVLSKMGIESEKFAPLSVSRTGAAH